MIIWFEFFYQNKKKEKRQINRMNPTLISGFEDVITHINQQEQRVMGLEEENKKLKAEMEKLEAKVLRLQSSEQDLEKKLDTGGWSPTSSIEPKQ